MNHVTITGYLAADPEIRYTPDGTPVATLTIADTPRTYNRTTGQWEDGTTLWLRAVAWRDLATNITDTLHKGDHVTATGRLTQRDYTSRDGQPRHAIELSLDDIAASLARATATITRRPPRTATMQAVPDQTSLQAQPTATANPDPWGSPAQPGH